MAELRDNVDQWHKSGGGSGGGMVWAKRVAVLLAVLLTGGALMAASGTLVIPGCGDQNGTRPSDAQVKPTKGPAKDQPKNQPKAGPAEKPAESATTEVEYETVTIAGKEFKLEAALNDQTRFKGLSDRKEIAPDGGMLFAFTRARHLDFVMRDCPIPIDIIFLDGSGRVTAFHKMTAEEPRRADEPKNEQDPTLDKYESRLKRYGSKYDAQFVIELKGDTLDSLKIKEGDQVKLDTVGLKKRAK